MFGAEKTSISISKTSFYRAACKCVVAILFMCLHIRNCTKNIAPIALLIDIVCDSIVKRSTISSLVCVAHAKKRKICPKIDESRTIRFEPRLQQFRHRMALPVSAADSDYRRPSSSTHMFRANFRSFDSMLIQFGLVLCGEYTRAFGSLVSVCKSNNYTARNCDSSVETRKRRNRPAKGSNVTQQEQPNHSKSSGAATEAAANNDDSHI